MTDATLRDLFAAAAFMGLVQVYGSRHDQQGYSDVAARCVGGDGE